MSNMNIKRNITRIIFADTIPAEFIMGVFAVTAGFARELVAEDRRLATVVICVGTVRLVALLLGIMWLRLAIAYIAVFSWTYFILFVFLETPSPHLPGSIVGAVANMWVAWRLQSDSHVRKTLIKDVGR